MEPLDSGDTIVAVATAPGRGALAIVRISGADAIAFLQRRCVRALDWRQHSRRQVLTELRDQDGRVVDQVIISFFASPRSYTGEDMAEICCHGSPWIQRRILEVAIEDGLRVAKPGEFTQRGFLSGKLDLLQAEAVRDLIGSETAWQAKVAREQLEGGLSRFLQPLKSELVGIISEMETALEFVEDDVTPAGRDQLLQRLEEVDRVLSGLESSFRLGRLVQEGLRVVLAGPPNAGKSSVFNALMQEERAIVSNLPGTTRDFLRERVMIAQVPVELVDTAGLREAEDRIEGMGVERALEAMAEGDLILFIVDGSEPFGSEARSAWKLVKGRRPILVVNKVDLTIRFEATKLLQEGCADRVDVSATKAWNLEGLREVIGNAALGAGEEREGAILTSIRHKEEVLRSREALARAAGALREGISEEYVLYDLRKALEGLGRLSGEVGVEEILGRIFSTFCIGK